MSIYLDAALAGWDAGLSMLLIRQDGTKSPAGKWKRRQQRRCTRRALDRLYSRGRRTGVGFVTGSVSGGVQLFEFDCHQTYETFLVAADYTGLGDLVARVRTGYEEETPGGGVHWLLRCSEIGTNTKLASRPKTPDERKHPKDSTQVLIETREEGGFVITAPSAGRVHPSGKSYRLVSGGFATIATITPEERRALYTLAESFDQMPVKEYRPATERRVAATGNRPGDDFAARTSWAAILEPAGWTFAGESGDVGHWWRPGKGRGQGISATTNYAGSGLFYPFSTSTNFEPGRGYGKFSVYAILNHGADFKAAARELAATGYGTQDAVAALPPALEPLDLAPVPDTSGCPELAEENARLRAQLAEERRLRIAAETELAAYKAALSNTAFTPAERAIGITYIEDLATAQQRGRVDQEGFSPNANTVIAQKVGIKPANIAKHLTVITASCSTIERDKVTERHKSSNRAKLHGSKVEALQDFARAARVEPTAKRTAWGGTRPAICPVHPTAAIITKTHTTYHCGRCDRELSPEGMYTTAAPAAEDTQVGHAPVRTEPRLVPHTQVGYPSGVMSRPPKELRDGQRECVLCHHIGRYELCPAHDLLTPVSDAGPPADLTLWDLAPKAEPELERVQDDDAPLGVCAQGCGRQVPPSRSVCLVCQSEAGAA